MIHKLIVETFEGDDLYPVVTHVFRSTTAERTVNVYLSHLQTDSFLRACVAQKSFGVTPCRTTSRWEIE